METCFETKNKDIKWLHSLSTKAPRSQADVKRHNWALAPTTDGVRAIAFILAAAVKIFPISFGISGFPETWIELNIHFWVNLPFNSEHSII